MGKYSVGFLFGAVLIAVGLICVDAQIITLIYEWCGVGKFLGLPRQMPWAVGLFILLTIGKGITCRMFASFLE
jgi:hypothetical protein